jgi:hypothetical protein
MGPQRDGRRSCSKRPCREWAENTSSVAGPTTRFMAVEELTWERWVARPVFDSQVVEETDPPSKLSQFRTRPERARISKMGRSGGETNPDRNIPRVRRGFYSRLVEGMLLSSKLLRIGRLPEFAESNVSLGNAGIEIPPRSTGGRTGGPGLLSAYTSLVLQEPAQPAQPSGGGSWAFRDGF